MYMRVKLLNGYKESLTYKIPSAWPLKNLVGAIVEVPLQKRNEIAFVEELFETLDDSATYQVREALSNNVVPSDPHYMGFIKKLASYYALDQLSLLRRIRHFMQEREQENPLELSPAANETEFKMNALTQEQSAVLTALIEALDAGTYYPALLQGVTGSG